MKEIFNKHLVETKILHSHYMTKRHVIDLIIIFLLQ